MKITVNCLGDKYYFGALHGELDYYFFVGDHVAHVLNELTQLTGRTHLKPKYVFGYHQGGYGPSYNNKWSLLQVALQYREAKIPCDGMHVDVDFQNNYRTFTHSPTKFPNPKEFFNALHDWGYKVENNLPLYFLADYFLQFAYSNRLAMRLVEWNICMMADTIYMFQQNDTEKAVKSLY